MADILLDAHGTWDPGSEPAYTIVPKGSTLKYFTENMRLFGDSNISRLKLLSSEPNQEVGSQKQVQNYTVSPAPETANLITPAGMVLKTAPGTVLFCTSDKCAQEGWHSKDWCSGLFSDPDYEGSNIYFAVCRHIKLNPTGLIPQINSMQQEIGAVEGGVPDDQMDAMIDGLASQGVDWADEWTQLGSDDREQVRQMLVSGDWILASLTR